MATARAGRDMEPLSGPTSPPNYRLVLVISLVLGIAFIAGVLFLISLTDLSNRETTLLGTVLTLLSIGIGWGVSHYYSTQDKRAAIEEIREFEQRNLRTYALKAAEKVTNLSKELNRLSAYLQEELQYTGYRNAEEELFAKEERIESAIHMLGSLRSINDTSLSDWQGVIGEELEEQRETEKEQAEALRQLGDRLSALELAPITSSSVVVENTEIDEIKRQLRSLAADISGGGFRAKPRPSYQHVDATCPRCSSPMMYGQRAKENDRKAVQCKVCEANLISTYREATGFVLAVRGHTNELVTCPNCSTEQSIELDEWPTASATVSCSACEAAIRVSRAENGQTVRVSAANQQKPAEPLTPEIVERVRSVLPRQPWPKGIHQTVAAQLSLRPGTVQKVIQHLIRTGVFMDQIDGVVCTTAEKLTLLRTAGTKL
jgi:hypothetical protein